MSDTLVIPNLFQEKVKPKRLQRLSRYEGGLNTKEVGGGGVSNMGVTQDTYNAYRKRKNLPIEDVKNITVEEKDSIFDNEFYEKPKLNTLPENVGDIVFDYGVNASPRKAIKDFQSIIGTKPDGLIGPETQKKTNEYINQHGEKDLLKNILNKREEHNKSLIEKAPDTYKKFEKGWQNRINDLKEEFDISSLNPFSVKEANAAVVSDKVIPNLFGTPKSNPNVVKGLFDEPKQPQQTKKPIPTLSVPRGNYRLPTQSEERQMKESFIRRKSIVPKGQESEEFFMDIVGNITFATAFGGPKGIGAYSALKEYAKLEKDPMVAGLSPAQKAGRVAMSGGGGYLIGKMFEIPNYGKTLIGRTIQAFTKSEPSGQGAISAVLNRSLGSGAVVVTESMMKDMVSGSNPDIKKSLSSGARTAVLMGIVGSVMELPAFRGKIMSEANSVADRAGKPRPANYQEARQLLYKSGIEPEKLSPYVQRATYQAKKDLVVKDIDRIASDIGISRKDALGVLNERNIKVRSQLVDSWFAKLAKINPDKALRLAPFRDAIAKGSDPVELYMNLEIDRLAGVKTEMVAQQNAKTNAGELEAYNKWLESKRFTQRTELDAPLHPAPKTSIDKGVVQRLFDEPVAPVTPKVPQKKQSLISAIKERGGLGTKQIKKDYNWNETVKQGKIPVGIFKRGASELDDMANQLQSEGLLRVPNDMNPGDYLMEQLKDQQFRNADLFAQDLESQYDTEYEEWIKQEAEQDDKIKDTEIERIEKDIEEEVKGEVDTEEIPDWVTEKQEGETEEIPNEVITKTREDGFAAGSIEEKKQTAKNLFNFLEEGDIVERDREIVEKDASGNYVEKTITDTGKVVIEDGRKIVKGTISGGSKTSKKGLELDSGQPFRLFDEDRVIKSKLSTPTGEGKVGGAIEEYVLNANNPISKTGRQLTPIPKTKAPSNRMAAKQTREWDAWLLENAKEEVKGNSYQETLLKAINLKNISPSDRDILNLMLFGTTDARIEYPTKTGGATAGSSAAAVSAKGQGYGGIIEPSEKSSKVKVAKTDYAKLGEEIPSSEETNIIKEALKIVAPARVSEATEGAGLILRKNIAELARKDVLAIESMKKAHSAFTWMSKDDAYEFIDNIEQGKPQTNSKLQPFSDMMRKLLDERRTNIQNLGKGQLEGYYENYFPHIWKDPKKAKDIVMQIMGRKRLEGTKSFLKKRIIVSVKDGVARGLEPVSDNPVDLVLLKLHEMDRYLMSQNIIRELKQSGLVKFVYSRKKSPDGYSRINDNAFTVFMPPEITKKEAYDSIMVDQLMDISKTLGIDTKRFVSIGTRGWGWARNVGQGQVRTKYASPESVLAHEIGHVIGYRYGVYNLIGRRQEGETKVHKKGKKAGQEYFKPAKEAVEYRRTIDNQWRALADARWKGLKADESYKKYVRNSREKEAVLVEALIHAPKEFQKVAPDLYKHFVQFINSESVLRPLLDVEPSLVLGESDAKIKIPGFTTLGHYCAPQDVARLINNHLSPGLRNADNKLIFSGYNILRGVGNVLNQVNLSLSGFHAINVSTDMMASTLGLGLRKLMTKNQRLGGLKDLITVPFAPIEGIWNGTRIKKAYRQQLDSIKDPKLREMIQAVVAAGGRDRMDIFYYNQQIKALQATFRDILQGSGIEKLWGITRLPFNVFGSVVEVLAKPIMEWYVPTGKLGLFAKLASHEMQRAESGEIKDSQLWERLASVWDSVDNRMGQLIYDNLFWNKSLKDGLMLAIRSVGWNLGSWREYAGAGVDLATTVSRVKKGDKIFSQKMAYVTGAAVVYTVLGAVITYILTGKPPEEPKDYFFPKTGRKNSDGSDERLSLPTYAKDVYAYSQRPLQTVKNKAHPLIGLLSEEFRNEDFYNVQIANPKDHLFDQIVNRGKHIVNYSKPFSVKNYEKMQRAGEGSKATAFVSITGITSAPAYVSRSAAQKLMYRYVIDRIPDATRTKEDYDKSEYRKTLKNRIRKGEKVDFQEAYEYLGTKSLKKTIKEAAMPPFAELYKRLSVNEAMNVYAIATPNEKQQTQSILIDKFRRAYKDKKITPDMMLMFKELFQK